MGNVKLEHVTKRYGTEVAVDDVNLDVADGEFVTFVGPSGCGKSTTLRMVAGLDTPSEGRVYIADTDVTDLPARDRGIAMVFQNIALFPHLDVRDNISFGLRLRDYPDEEIDARVEEAVDTVQLEGLLDRMPDQLSGGQRQRVAIARAIVREPEVFLMDEPLANLDAKLRVHMRTELQRLHRKLDTTIVYVTHDQAEAMTMSDRIAVLDAGRLQQFARPLECYFEPANQFVAGFIGSPSMNFVDGRLTPDGFESEWFDVSFDPDAFGLTAGEATTLGVRPEDIYPVGEGGEQLLEPSAPFEGTADVIEPMGDEVFVYLVLDEREAELKETAGDSQVLMSVTPNVRIEPGQDVEFVLDRGGVHLFDAEDGRALVHGLTKPDMLEPTRSEQIAGSD